MIHDSALCFEAYENGQSGLRSSVQWKDAYEETRNENSADFIALRELHAKQAEKLLYHAWKDPDNKNELYLLENQTLRKHFGQLIGQIASSHHWDIETLTQRLSIQQNVLPEYPREWRVDPIKLACIIRCADACHIDNLRAPDFLHALIKRNRISLDHWRAQNKLARVDIDLQDSKRETLLFTSTIDFSEEESNAWFVVYDAVRLIDKEIKSSNNLLKSYNPNYIFKIKQVKGVDSPERLSTYIKVKDWKPCSAQIHVGNIERLIDNLGGEMLYGSGTDLLAVVLRELIQNARDAIKARSYSEEQFKGKINLKIETHENETFLIVEDNGIGMSERVLTGPLLDFGTSFWSSSLIKNEFPGLRSSGFKSIGKFGIGFYSIFMIAEKVIVSSRNWNKGLDEVHQLKFTNGFTLRPILKKGSPEKFNSAISTQVVLKISEGFLTSDLMVEIKTNTVGSTNFKVPITTYISAICAGIDVDVFYLKDKNTSEIIHKNITDNDFDPLKWLKTISFSEYRDNDNIKNYVEKNYQRLKPIEEDEQLVGLAAISTTVSNHQSFLSISTVGGLSQNVHHRGGDKFIGFLDFSPKSAKRDVNKYVASDETLKKWANEQMNELLEEKLNPYENNIAASAISEFKVDPRPIAQILVSVSKKMLFLKFDQLADLSLTVGIAFITSDLGGGQHIDLHNSINDLPNYVLVRPITNSSFLSLKHSKEGIPEEEYSILHCLWESCKEKGYTPQLNMIEDLGTNNIGYNLNALILKSELN